MSANKEINYAPPTRGLTQSLGFFMKAVIYFRNFLVIVGAVALISLTAFFFPPESGEQKDVFDWTILGAYPNATDTALAVLERGVSNTGANTAPRFRVELRTKNDSEKWLNHRYVWNSHVREAPTVKWVDGNILEIRHLSEQVLEYEPEVKLNNATYWVRLDVVPSKP